MKQRLALVCLALPTMAAGQASGPQNGNQTSRTRDSECAVGSTSDEVVVCGRRERGEKYRLPLREERFEPGGSVQSVSRERNRLLEGAGSALGSCTNVGPNGMTGCLSKEVWRRREQYGR